uniref:Uncharacterized protein n=1 Tax=Arundo donax TaxID=35708 RepID=A0A0A9GC27_ARUDO
MRALPQGLSLPERSLLYQALLLPSHISCGNMEDHLEIGAPLGQLAHMLHPHHIHIQGHIIPLVEVGGGGSINDDVEFSSHLCQLGPLHAEILIDDVSSQRNDLLLDEGLEPFAMLLPQKPKQLLPDHLSLHPLLGRCCIGCSHRKIDPLDVRLDPQYLLHQYLSEEAC